MRIKAVNASTLGYMVENGYSIWADCLNIHCLNSIELDLPGLVEVLSPALDVVDHGHKIRNSLACSVCGSKGAQLTISPKYGHAGHIAGQGYFS